MTITDTSPTARPAEIDHWTGAPGDAHWIATARTIAPQLAKNAAQHDSEGSFVQDGFDLLRDQGFLSMLVPSELGGGGASHAEACAVMAELARGCPATSLSFSMHSHLLAAQVWRHNRGLPAPVLAKVAADQIVLISTGASDWIKSSGTATKVPGGFRVSAEKLPASGCPAGNVLATSIRWDDAPDGPQVIHASIPFTAEGVSIVETWDTMGMRGTGSHTVVLDNVFVPDEAVPLIRNAGEWHPVFTVVVGVALPLVMSTYVGVAETAVEHALVLANGRAERPEVAPLVGRMLNRLTLAQDTVRAMIDASGNMQFDNTEQHASGSLSRKSNAVEACIDTVRIALEVGGGASYTKNFEIERLFRDVHASLYHPLPTPQQERFTGRLTLGLDPMSDL